MALLLLNPVYFLKYDFSGTQKQPDPEDAAEAHRDSLLKSSGASTGGSVAELGHACPKGGHFPVLPAGVSYLPPNCSSLIPVLLPQPQVGRSYALYVHHAPVRPHASARPQPTSLAVRSMTFESPGGHNTKASPVTMPAAVQTSQLQGYDPTSPSLKRGCAEMEPEGSPSKIKRPEVSSMVCVCMCGIFLNLGWQ